jgi:DNA-binding transcriptional ArsR family regulator
MLHLLTEGERNLSELAAPFRISFPAASKHVRVLERARLVQRRIVGRKHMCRIDGQPLGAATDWLEQYRRHWEERFDRLDALLDDMQARDQNGA